MTCSLIVALSLNLERFKEPSVPLRTGPGTSERAVLDLRALCLRVSAPLPLLQAPLCPSALRSCGVLEDGSLLAALSDISCFDRPDLGVFFL